MEVLEEVRRLLKERTYLKKEDYLRKNLDFKISKTKPITKEPSLVDYLFTVLSIKMINLCTSRQKYRLFPTFLGKYGERNLYHLENIYLCISSVAVQSSDGLALATN